MPSGTAGETTGLTYTPASNSALQVLKVNISSPMIIGIMGVTELPVFNPSDLYPLRMYSPISLTRATRSGSSRITCNAARAAAVLEGGMLALEVGAGGKGGTEGMAAWARAIKPPREANDLLKVDMI